MGWMDETLLKLYLRDLRRNAQVILDGTPTGPEKRLAEGVMKAIEEYDRGGREPETVEEKPLPARVLYKP